MLFRSAVWTLDHHDFTLTNSEIEAGEGGEPSEKSNDTPEFDDWSGEYWLDFWLEY